MNSASGAELVSAQVSRVLPFRDSAALKPIGPEARTLLRTVNQKIAALYDGLEPPALHRYGETDDRKREVM